MNTKTNTARQSTNVEVFPVEEAKNPKSAKRAARFITRIWREQPGDYFFLATASRGERPGRGTSFSRDEFDKVEDFIRKNRRKNLWWCVHGFSERERQKDCAIDPVWLFADLDKIKPETLRVKPTILFETSPGSYGGLWRMDEAVGFDVNKRISYACAEDKGGWMRTKLLRVPYTVNRKPTRKDPTVRVVWQDGPKYTIDSLNEGLGPWAKVSDRAMGLLRKKREAGDDRSDHRAKIVNHLIREGFNNDDIYTLLSEVLWGGDDEKKLRADIERLRSKPIKGMKSEEPGKLIMKTMTAYKARNNTFLWSKRILRGKVNIFAGEGGVGKGHVVAAIAAAVSSGSKLPFHKGQRYQGHVIYLQLEDDPDEELKARLMAADANLEYVHNIEGIERGGKEVEFDISRDLDRIDEAVKALDGKLRLLIVDPLADFLGVSAIDEVKLRTALKPLRRWAKKRRVAVIAVLHMNKKADVKNARQRMSGSVAMPNISRSAFFFGMDPKDEDVRAMFHDKSNLGKKCKPLAFTIKSCTVEGIKTSNLEWLKGHEVDFSSSDALDCKRACYPTCWPGSVGGVMPGHERWI